MSTVTDENDSLQFVVVDLKENRKEWQKEGISLKKVKFENDVQQNNTFKAAKTEFDAYHAAVRSTKAQKAVARQRLPAKERKEEPRWEDLKNMDRKLEKNEPCSVTLNTEQRTVTKIRANHQLNATRGMETARIFLKEDPAYQKAIDQKPINIREPDVVESSVEQMEEIRDCVLAEACKGNEACAKDHGWNSKFGNNFKALQHYNKGTSAVRVNSLTQMGVVRCSPERRTMLTCQNAKESEVTFVDQKTRKEIERPQVTLENCESVPLPVWAKYRQETAARRVLKVRSNGGYLVLQHPKESKQKLLKNWPEDAKINIARSFKREQLDETLYSTKGEVREGEMLPAQFDSKSNGEDGTPQRICAKLKAEVQQAGDKAPLRKIIKVTPEEVLLEVPVLGKDKFKAREYSAHDVQVRQPDGSFRHPSDRLDVCDGDEVKVVQRDENGNLQTLFEGIVSGVPHRGHTEQMLITPDFYNKMLPLARRPCGKQLPLIEKKRILGMSWKERSNNLIEEEWQAMGRNMSANKHYVDHVRFHLRDASVGLAFSNKNDRLTTANAELKCKTLDEFFALGVPRWVKEGKRDLTDFIIAYVCKEENDHYFKWVCPARSAATPRFRERLAVLNKLFVREAFGRAGGLVPVQTTWRQHATSPDGSMIEVVEEAADHDGRSDDEAVAPLSTDGGLVSPISTDGAYSSDTDGEDVEQIAEPQRVVLQGQKGSADMTVAIAAVAAAQGQDDADVSYILGKACTIKNSGEAVQATQERTIIEKLRTDMPQQAVTALPILKYRRSLNWADYEGDDCAY